MIGAKLARPYVELCLSQTSDALRRRLDGLGRPAARCEDDGADLEIHVAWPVALPARDASRACPVERWTYAVGADGAARLLLERERSRPDLKDPRLPSSFTLR
jgi:hypothetical protein